MDHEALLIRMVEDGVIELPDPSTDRRVKFKITEQQVIDEYAALIARGAALAARAALPAARTAGAAAMKAAAPIARTAGQAAARGASAAAKVVGPAAQKAISSAAKAVGPAASRAIASAGKAVTQSMGAATKSATGAGRAAAGEAATGAGPASKAVFRAAKAIGQTRTARKVAVGIGRKVGPTARRAIKKAAEDPRVRKAVSDYIDKKAAQGAKKGAELIQKVKEKVAGTDDSSTPPDKEPADNQGKKGSGKQEIVDLNAKCPEGLTRSSTFGAPEGKKRCSPQSYSFEWTLRSPLILLEIRAAVARPQRSH